MLILEAVRFMSSTLGLHLPGTSLCCLPSRPLDGLNHHVNPSDIPASTSKMARQLQFLFVVLSIFSLLSDSVLSLDIHIPLRRRNGRFARHGFANLTLLSETLDNAEHRYSSTDRSVANNGLVRRWRTKDAALDDDALLSAMENGVPW